MGLIDDGKKKLEKASDKVTEKAKDVKDSVSETVKDAKKDVKHKANDAENNLYEAKGRVKQAREDRR